MQPDLSKLILYTPDNAYKNVSVYSGSLIMPTALNSGQTITVTSSFTLTDNPVFYQFYAEFLELIEAIDTYGSSNGTTPIQWYSANVASGSVAIHTITSPFTGWFGANIYPVINGNTVTVNGTVINPYGSNVTMNAVTIPFCFIEYTLAN